MLIQDMGEICPQSSESTFVISWKKTHTVGRMMSIKEYRDPFTGDRVK